MYDSTVITLILVVDSLLLYFSLVKYNKAQKARNTRRFNKILQSVGLK